MKRIVVIAPSFLPTADTIGSILYRVILNIEFKEVNIFSRKIENESEFPNWLLKNDEKIKLNSQNYLKIDGGKKIVLLRKIKRKIKEIMKILKYLITQNSDIILTSTMPENNHWYGYIAKLINKKTVWIAFFSDPYSNSPFENVGNSKVKLFFRKIEEKLVFKYSDRIIYVSESQREFCYKGKDKEKQTIIFPFYYLSSWKEKIIINIKSKNIYNKNLINFVHPGNIYGNRNPAEFFKALKKFENDIHYYNCGKFEENLIKKYKLEKNITSLGFVDYEKLLENIKEADYVIVIDSFFKKIKNPYMPSKVVDAMYFDKPIIAITDEGTELDKFCKITGNISLRNNSEIIESKLKELINKNLRLKPDYSMYCDLKFKII